MQNRISHVAEGGPAECAGIVPGDRLLSVNGNRIQDVLDYMYYAYDAESEFEIERADGTVETLTLIKDDGQDAGIDFEEYLMDKPRSCANNCIFCFVDQLPPGLRKTLYFKDDDVRLSFLTGSYITLTNMSEREIQRIIDLKISPINVSVHTMNPSLRCMMLGNRNGGKGIEIIRRLAKAGIEMNCQIVCCPGINDGRELSYTMRELAKLYPSMNSVSVIPVGLTRHREGLMKLTPFDKESAGGTIDLVEKFADRCLKKRGSRIFFCSDEFYLKAEREIHDEEYYEGYPQLENGVGLLRLLITEFDEALEDAEEDGLKAEGTPFSIATGVSAAVTLGGLLDKARKKYDNIDGRVYAIKNDFFGHTVDVAGLITGQDLIAQLEGRDLGSRVYITNRMLKEDEDIFLDDVTLEEAERRLGVPIIPMKNDGAELLRVMLS
ncbi:MAG: DUF512 domain-containing protein [Oscillospiraceae bacterium]